MQVTEPAKDELRDAIHAAFDDITAPSQVEGMLFERYKSSEDAYEMAAEFAGKRWSEIPIARLFYHREMLATLSAAAYRAYLPAYLAACLESEDPFDKYGADIRSYLVSTLKAWPHQQPGDAVLVSERLSLLDSDQRAAVKMVLHYLEERWRMKDATEILRDW